MNNATQAGKVSNTPQDAAHIAVALVSAAILGALMYWVLRQLPSLVELRTVLLTKFQSYQGLATYIAPVLFCFMMAAQVVNTVLCIIGRRLQTPRQPGKSAFFWLVSMALMPAILATALVLPLPRDEVGNFSLLVIAVLCTAAAYVAWKGVVFIAESDDVANVNSGVVEAYYGNPVQYFARAKFLLALAYLVMGFSPLTAALWAAMGMLDYLLCSVGAMPHTKRTS